MEEFIMSSWGKNYDITKIVPMICIFMSKFIGDSAEMG